MRKHSQEKSGKLVWKTDRMTEWQTDRVQTYSPLRFHRWGTNKHVYSIYNISLGDDKCNIDIGGVFISRFDPFIALWISVCYRGLCHRTASDLFHTHLSGEYSQWTMANLSLFITGRMYSSENRYTLIITMQYTSDLMLASDFTSNLHTKTISK